LQNIVFVPIAIPINYCNHINNQVKESLELEGVKISETLVDILYKSEKADIRRAVAKYARDNNIEVDFGPSELTD